MADLITIANDALSAAINPLGAELTHLKDAQGRELMTDADPAYWTGHAPILFPVIGMTNGGVVRVNGREYPMPKHGVARRHLFALTSRSMTSATFSLCDDDTTRAAYPFAFELQIAFMLEDARLTLTATILNRGEKPMPAQFGFHPAFAWPLPFGCARAEHHIVFDQDEAAKLREIAPDGLIAVDKRASPLDGRVLHLADELFEHDALVWDPVASDAVTYGASDGPQLRVAFPDTPRLGVWTKPGAHFVCIEPWHGIADPEGFTGELSSKPGIFVVAPDDEKRVSMSIALVP